MQNGIETIQMTSLSNRCTNIYFGRYN